MIASIELRRVRSRRYCRPSADARLCSAVAMLRAGAVLHDPRAKLAVEHSARPRAERCDRRRGSGRYESNRERRERPSAEWAEFFVALALIPGLRSEADSR